MICYTRGFSLVRRGLGNVWLDLANLGEVWTNQERLGSNKTSFGWVHLGDIQDMMAMLRPIRRGLGHVWLGLANLSETWAQGC